LPEVCVGPKNGSRPGGEWRAQPSVNQPAFKRRMSCRSSSHSRDDASLHPSVRNDDHRAGSLQQPLSPRRGRFAERGGGNRAYRHVRSSSAGRFPCSPKNGEGTA
jgi:hypothetical protein